MKKWYLALLVAALIPVQTHAFGWVDLGGPIFFSAHNSATCAKREEMLVSVGMVKFIYPYGRNKHLTFVKLVNGDFVFICSPFSEVKAKLFKQVKGK